jgi:hypothetical protein
MGWTTKGARLKTRMDLIEYAHWRLNLFIASVIAG